MTLVTHVFCTQREKVYVLQLFIVLLHGGLWSSLRQAGSSTVTGVCGVSRPECCGVRGVRGVRGVTGGSDGGCGCFLSSLTLSLVI